MDANFSAKVKDVITFSRGGAKIGPRLYWCRAFTTWYY